MCVCVCVCVCVYVCERVCVCVLQQLKKTCLFPRFKTKLNYFSESPPALYRIQTLQVLHTTPGGVINDFVHSHWQGMELNVLLPQLVIVYTTNK